MSHFRGCDYVEKTDNFNSLIFVQAKANAGRASFNMGASVGNSQINVKAYEL